MPKTARKQVVRESASREVFGQGRAKARAGLYARVSTHDQQTLPMQLAAMRQYVRKRGWTVAIEVQEVASGAKERPERQRLIDAAKRRDVDAIVVWRLDRWGRSVADLVTTLHDLTTVDVGFISLNEALDLTTPSGRALAGMLAVFAEFERDILRDRVRAGIAQARKEGKPHGRPKTAAKLVGQMRELRKEGVSNRKIAERLGVSRTSVIRLLSQPAKA
jgi:putative DNA-invertase from lambdoid prophage Rac